MYQVKKSKARRGSLRSPRPTGQVVSSLPDTKPVQGRAAGSVGGDSEQWLGREYRLLDRYALQGELADTLKQTKRFSRLAARVAECHRSFRHKVCDRNHQWAEATKSCNCRLCPHDQRKRSLRLAHRWEKHLLGRDGLRYCVFSERNTADLSAGIASLYRAWARLRKSSLWKAAAHGAIVVLEVTYNREEETWHPHLNVLFAGLYIPFEALNQAWIAATKGNGQTSFIRAADAGTIRELIKYVTKLSDFVDNPLAVNDFLAATARKRFVRTYGEFYQLPVDDEDNEEHCPDCDSTCIADVGIAHAQQLYIDYKGVIRIDLSRLRPSQFPVSEDIPLAWPRAPIERDFPRWSRPGEISQQENRSN